MSKPAAWYFTAPWDPVPVRRGDALGLRAGADYFAELLAPGLSNGTSDARWISLLSWCLKWSHVAWRNAGGGNLSRRDDQRARYAWLRPLELLWVARALVSKQTTGQLRGRRSVKRWLDAINDRRWLPNFAMSPDQFRRYRQVGTYGAYRVVFRAVPGLTTGDGWTPDVTTLALANLVNESLPRVARLSEEHFENGTKWGRWSGGDEARYWVERGWKTSREMIGGFLPTPEDMAGKRLPEQERRLLEPALFSTDSTRRVTAEVLAGAKGARSHAELCDALANSSAMSKQIEPLSLAPLPAFTRLADAAMHAMRGLWNEINHDHAQQAPAVEKLARANDLPSRFGQLREASLAWFRAPGRSHFPQEGVVTRLAEAMRDAKTPIQQLRALSQHHHEYGGGRRWFREQAGKLVPLVADTGIAASDYRFRLRSLCHLASQCGVANLNVALQALTERTPVDEDGDLL
ncbi:MAG: hypothetical protein U1A78_16710 [Polyangia bacterium]